MKVCIAEKPSVAASIAAILGAKNKKDGYYEGNGYQVTWTFGHLCELKTPESYNSDWKKWSLNTIPMIPDKFGIELKDDGGIKKQFSIIERLFKAAEVIINCGDAGQEGELIQRWVLQKTGIKDKKVLRLWINSLTDEAIRDGFAHLEPQSKYDSLYYAGLCRACGDWVLGMNCTRLFTLRYVPFGQKQILSIGRVQTPTLAMVVARHLEITNFKPQKYWELKTIYRDTTFSCTEGRYDNLVKAQQAQQLASQSPFTITNIEKKQGKESPKKLYDLTSLQVDCNKKFGLSADQTLKTIQSLYEKKLATYPRVDTTYLPDDVYPKCKQILAGLTAYHQYVSQLVSSPKPLPKSKMYFDSSKVTDHHAIIPTGSKPSSLSSTEQGVFDLIAKRFISIFFPDCIFSTTTITGTAARVVFRTSGKTIEDLGWKAIYTYDAPDEDDKDEPTIRTVFTKGESGPHKPSLAEKWTQPPKPYTEATLLRAMETAGKQCEDETLRDAMKENGIGRPSTRAAILETLFARQYIVREKKNIVPTATGIDVIKLIRQPILKSAELTGQWERRLREIEHGKGSAAVFMDDMKTMLKEIVTDVKNDNSGAKVTVLTPPPPKSPSKTKSSNNSKKPKK